MKAGNVVPVTGSFSEMLEIADKCMQYNKLEVQNFDF
jgi:hypothetical protein